MKLMECDMLLVLKLGQDCILNVYQEIFVAVLVFWQQSNRQMKTILFK
jgi:hypothetical protein